MCGIVGIVGSRQKPELFSQMLESIAHRGPDAEGTSSGTVSPQAPMERSALSPSDWVIAVAGLLTAGIADWLAQVSLPACAAAVIMLFGLAGYVALRWQGPPFGLGSADLRIVGIP